MNLKFPTGPVERLSDSGNAFWTRNAKSSIQGRVTYLTPGSPFSVELVRACQRGLLVQLELPVSAYQTAQAVKPSCVQVVISDHPELQRGTDVLLVDGGTLIVNGGYQGVGGRKVMQEYLFEREVREHAVSAF
ncbi:hypothetical protein F6X40_11270 [Paraburkholderia sp. UCT31]|uniref:hypothetical protein n=1 Tax=Paraburkholderia sp. UCT31 TaxID=2615209 RepID=UPI0016566ADE|nr:hypothetical protein [Paraburkholderia sp. UCT31]MBC8737384.1 hypothetical protein [Paraburkholderia sp. UCT31]